MSKRAILNAMGDSGDNVIKVAERLAIIHNAIKSIEEIGYSVDLLYGEVCVKSNNNKIVASLIIEEE